MYICTHIHTYITHAELPFIPLQRDTIPCIYTYEYIHVYMQNTNLSYVHIYICMNTRSYKYAHMHINITDADLLLKLLQCGTVTTI